MMLFSLRCRLLTTFTLIAIAMSLQNQSLQAETPKAESFNETLKIGDAAPAWEKLPGTDGLKHSLADLKESQIVVVVFTCVSCPTATDYETRINSLVENYTREQLAVVPICVNKIAADQLPALTKHVAEKSLKFQYLHDETQQIAQRFGAVFTPEFYVLNQERKIVYMGALDDSTSESEVKQQFLRDAIDATLKKEVPSITEVIARGCRVRYVRSRPGKSFTPPTMP